MSIRIYPYHRASMGARDLAKTCGILLATPQQIRKHGDFDHIINWGSGKEVLNGEYINHPRAVNRASNKLTASRVFVQAGVPTMDYTDDQAVAQQWWDDGEVVVIRKLLRGTKGRGIVLASRDDKTPIVPAPLYTKYMKKKDEYRVHVMRGQVIDVQQKKKRRNTNNDDFKIRNYHNGYVFCRGGVHAPACVTAASVAAVDALGLDFGGVDVGYNAHNDAACVYEVNTAPGIEGTTLVRYYEGLRAILPELQHGAYERRRGQ